MSRNIQAALRKFIPICYFDDVNKYIEQPAAASVLVYSSLPPSTGIKLDGKTLTLNTMLSIDGKEVAKTRIKEQIPQRCGTETMDIGMDCVSPVCNDYEKKGLFPFTGTIERVTIKFPAAKQPTGMDRLKLATKMD